ncbi:UBX domain-containing protein [Cavenderia fasciculata]|uniref:UBX domain-containing protein n=1 Tax=Cavenderia fasciculata TaxID=261658 RepID=F4PZS3_CACFS|nr:UBX domain-containing protein [Cavenderia fasciculata]EGG18837.1 UBX domain-containing protein [Cavenderia fasciculata]|eukprot:XP_004357299.1 UBX domain-containing protein [Cavenderia fasciculata]
MSSNYNRNRNQLHQNRIQTINQLNSIRNSREDSPPTPSPSYSSSRPTAPSQSTSLSSSSSTNIRSSGGLSGGVHALGGSSGSLPPLPTSTNTSSPRISAGGRTSRENVEEYDVGDVHVRTTRRSTPNGYTQSVERTSNDGNTQSSYTTQVTSFSSSSTTSQSPAGGRGGGTPRMSNSPSTRVAGLSPSTHYRPQFQVSQSTNLNRPGSFMDSNFRNYYDHPALNPYYRSPIGELSSINGQRRTYTEDIPDGNMEQEEDDEEEDEFEDMDDTVDQSLNAARNRQQAQIIPSYMNFGIDDDGMNEDEQLREAIRRSQEQSLPQQPAPPKKMNNNSSFDMDQEDLELQRALTESMREFQEKTSTSSTTPLSSSSSSVPKKKVNVRQDLNEYYSGTSRQHQHQKQQQQQQQQNNINNNNGNDESENEHTLEAMYNDPELRHLLSPAEQQRLARKRLIDDARKIRESQESEFNESLRRDTEKREEEEKKRVEEEKKKAEQEEKKLLQDALKLSIHLEKQSRIEEIKKRLTVDPSTMPAEEIKGREKEICEISVNLPPDGKRITRKFFTSNTLQNIRDWIDIYLDETFNIVSEDIHQKKDEEKQDEEMKQVEEKEKVEVEEGEDKREKRYISRDYQLLTTYPKQVLSDNQKSLLDLQLYPRCLLQLNNP